jgi:hypothetical protein
MTFAKAEVWWSNGAMELHVKHRLDPRTCLYSILTCEY